jgi:hypothetical protein
MPTAMMVCMCWQARLWCTRSSRSLLHLHLQSATAAQRLSRKLLQLKQQSSLPQQMSIRWLWATETSRAGAAMLLLT